MTFTSLMKTKLFLAVVLLAVAGYAAYAFLESPAPSPLPPALQEEEPSVAAAMAITSPAFGKDEMIPVRYTCDGDDVIPPLAWSGAPEGTRSFVLIFEDPTFSVPYVHWVRFNIPSDAEGIEEGREPAGRAGRGSSGRTTYFGSCPPTKQHRYAFNLYALDTMLDPKSATKAEVVAAMEGHILATSTLHGTYIRLRNR